MRSGARAYARRKPGLKGKSGEIPARSRHCNGEVVFSGHWGHKPWEGKTTGEPEPGNLPDRASPLNYDG